MKLLTGLIFCYIFLLGIFFSLLVPPLQKPDEHGHFKRAVYLRNGYVFLWNDGRKLPLDAQFYDLIHDGGLNAMPYRPNVKMNLNFFKKPVFAPNKAFNFVYINEKAEFMLGAFAYIPHAFGLFIAKLFHFNSYISFYMVRLMMFIVSFIWMLILYKKTLKPYRFILLFVFSLPMFIHQITAYNYDGMNYMMGFTLFSYVIYLLHMKSISIRQLLIFGCIMVLYLMAKVIYEPMILLYFIFPYQKIAKDKISYLKKTVIWFFFVIFVYFLFKLPLYISSLSYQGHPAGVNPQKQLLFIFNHPLAYLINFVSSSLSQCKFHLQGLIGIFGWLDYSMDIWIYAVYILSAIAVIYFVNPIKKAVLSTKQILYFFTVLGISYSYIFTFFYLNWKPVGSPVIDGTQGRYFISFVPFGLYAMIHAKKNIHIYKFIFIAVLVAVFISILSSIIYRYY